MGGATRSLFVNANVTEKNVGRTRVLCKWCMDRVMRMCDDGCVDLEKVGRREYGECKREYKGMC